MAHNKLYRNFIILQEDERGYSHSNDKALSGYAKVEAKGDKCKVSFYAQNLRPEDNYSMVLICCKRDLKQLIDLGSLAINEVGKGDTSKEYYVNNIAGLGISYEKISGAAICRVKDNETDFIMHGFMNGEESTDNWRKFKTIKVDSKKYINKLDANIKKKDILSSDIADKAIISQSNNVETKFIKTSELQNELIERKKDENNLKSKANIEVEVLTENNYKSDKDIMSESNNMDIKAVKTSKLEEDILLDHKINEKEIIESESLKENAFPDGYQNIDKTIKNLYEDRNKCKEAKKYDKKDKIEENKKCDKYDKKDIMDESKKCDKYDKKYIIEEPKKCSKCEKNDIIEEVKKYNKYEKNDTVEEVIDNLAKKLDTYDGVIDLKINNIHDDIIVYGFIKDKKNKDCKWKKFKLDKKCRSDDQDFNNIQNNSKRIEQNFKLDELNQMDKKTDRLDIIDFDGYENNIQQTNLNSEMQPPVSKKIMQQENSDEYMQETGSKQDFKMSGEVGQYFEKLAGDFEPYDGSLTDINYCKLYKINVNNIEDLSDESNYNQYTLAYYPMLNYYPYISKAGYFLLGYKCNKDGEMKYIVYGIPGSREKNDQPYGGKTGFVTWTSDNENRIGYWLMFYDFKNSSIVIPTK